MRHTTEKNWRDDNDHDDLKFWENEINEYLQQNPSHQKLFDENVNKFEEEYI